jgi:hypothetical protein
MAAIPEIVKGMVPCPACHPPGSTRRESSEAPRAMQSLAAGWASSSRRWQHRPTARPHSRSARLFRRRVGSDERSHMCVVQQNSHARRSAPLRSAKHHEAGHHEKAAHHAHSAMGHAFHARGHAEEAAKAHAEEHGKK